MNTTMAMAPALTLHRSLRCMPVADSRSDAVHVLLTLRCRSDRAKQLIDGRDTRTTFQTSCITMAFCMNGVSIQLTPHGSASVSGQRSCHCPSAASSATAFFFFFFSVDSPSFFCAQGFVTVSIEATARVAARICTNPVKECWDF